MNPDSALQLFKTTHVVPDTNLLNVVYSYRYTKNSTIQSRKKQKSKRKKKRLQVAIGNIDTRYNKGK